MVAMLFSTVSGVLVRSCDPSLGAIFIVPVLTTLQHRFEDKSIVLGVLVDKNVLYKMVSGF